MAPNDVDKRSPRRLEVQLLWWPCSATGRPRPGGSRPVYNPRKRLAGPQAFTPTGDPKSSELMCGVFTSHLRLPRNGVRQGRKADEMGCWSGIF